MTTREVVADDVLGQVAKRQWELFRRVKEGTLDPNFVLDALQHLVQNEADLLDLEKVDWRISSRSYEIMSEQSADFVTRLSELGYDWRPPGRFTEAFILGPEEERLPRKRRVRLAELPGNPHVPFWRIKVYAEFCGFDLASAWDLLAFVQQCPAMKDVKEYAQILALGMYGKVQSNLESGYAHVAVDGYPNQRNWHFRGHHMAKTPEQLDEVRTPHSEIRNTYILLRERG